MAKWWARGYRMLSGAYEIRRRLVRHDPSRIEWWRDLA